MSVEKVALAKLYCSEMNIPFFAIFRFNDGSMKYARIDNQKFDVEINGRNDRNDKDDIEPVIKITKSHLRPFVRREARAAA
jgi:hypothetical protein